MTEFLIGGVTTVTFFALILHYQNQLGIQLIPTHEPLDLDTVLQESGDQDLEKPPKKSGWKKGDKIGIEKFTKPGKKGRRIGPKTRQYLEPDNATNSGSGTHDGVWKLKGSRGERLGTISEDGRWLRF